MSKQQKIFQILAALFFELNKQSPKYNHTNYCNSMNPFSSAFLFRSVSSDHTNIKWNTNICQIWRASSYGPKNIFKYFFNFFLTLLPWGLLWSEAQIILHPSRFNHRFQKCQILATFQYMIQHFHEQTWISKSLFMNNEHPILRKIGRKMKSFFRRGKDVFYR